MRKMRCAKCEAENREGRKFCAKCAAPLARPCPNCGASNEPDEDFCGECATPLAKSPIASVRKSSDAPIRVTETPVPESIDGERKTVTALFADIKDSTELEQHLDPEEARAIIDPALKLMVEAARRYDGYVVQSTGDGIFALFGAPLAHEDHPQRALYAALSMQEGLQGYSARLVANGGRPLQCRVGVNTGEVVVRTIETSGHTEYTPIGHVTNLAARMQTVAPSGSIATSEATRRLCEGYFEIRALGPTAIKGIDAPVEVYEVVRVGPLHTHFELAARRGLTHFVGRERELSTLAGALEQARGGHGQIVAAVAEAGTGKSRLVYEFKAALPDDCKVLHAYSVSHGKASAWLPVLDLLHDYFGIGETDDPISRREKICAVLAALDPALSDTVPYLWGLLGVHESPDPLARMDPQIRRRRTLEGLKRIILRASLNQPLVVIFEDLHWIDPETQALLDLLADSLAGARILLLVNYRPEYLHEWSSKGYYQQLRLDPLGGENAAVMLSALIGEGAELKPVKRLISERSGGNPFFIEEIVQALFDEGQLVRNGVVKVGRPLSQFRLPPTVQGVLASRIDRLPPAQKDLLQTLAVIGRESPLTLIRKLTSLAEEETERVLLDLQAREFIYEHPVPLGVEYVFKHALTQEVAYNSLLLERRKLLHERAGQALESIFEDHLDDFLGELARHYSHSNNSGKAIEYLERAAQQALQRCSYAVAIARISNGMEFLKVLPDDATRVGQELSFQIILGTSLMASRGWAAPEVERAFSRALELCHRMGEVAQLVPVLYGIWGFHLVRGELKKALEIGTRCLATAERSGSLPFLIAGHYTLGATSFWTGDLAGSLGHLDESIRHYDPTHHRMLAGLFGLDLGIGAIFYSAWALCFLGYAERAVERADKAVLMARNAAHPESLAWALLYKSLVHQARREVTQTRAAAEELFSISEVSGLVMQPAVSKLTHGWALAAEGKCEGGWTEIRGGFSAFSAPGMVVSESYGRALLAEAYLIAGRAQEGLLALEEPLTRTKSEEQIFAAELSRLRGELLLLSARSGLFSVEGEADALFRGAILTAKSHQSKWLELRATSSLARLLTSQDKREEARAMLAEIHGWFTEGFDTADLKDAKALLEEL
jgi:class 3 adenylate cyclase/tetratricopeptide (TPR) repeat protein